MGIYIQQSDLESRLGNTKLLELTDPDGTGTIQANIVAAAIAAAEGLFESYLRTRYQLPVPVTPLVTGLLIDMAGFVLYRGASTVDDGVYKVWQDGNEAAVKTLKDIQAGKAALDVPAAQETATTPGSENQVLRQSDRRPDQFNERNLRGY